MKEQVRKTLIREKPMSADEQNTGTFTSRLDQGTLRIASYLFAVALLGLLFFEVLALTGRSPSPHQVYSFHTMMLDPLFMSGALGAYLGYLFLPFRRTEFMLVTGVGILIEAALFQYRLPLRGLHFSVTLVGLGLAGMAALAILYRIVQGKEQRLVLGQYFILIFLIPFLMSGAGFLHVLIEAKTTLIYDVYAYAIDYALNFSPSFFVNRMVESAPVLLKWPSHFVYWELPMWMILAILLALAHPEKRSYHEPMATFALIGCLGVLSYAIFPCAGANQLFGAKFWDALQFADYHPQPSEFALRLIKGPPQIPRNAMPSLHAGWAFVFLLSLRGMSSRIFGLACFVTTFTIIGTLWQGHYLIDLAPSTTLAVASTAFTARPGTISLKSRWTCGILALAATEGYILSLRVGSDFLIRNPWATMTLQAVTVLIAVLLEQRLYGEYVQSKEDKV
jgi:PAP2 superfamily